MMSTQKSELFVGLDIGSSFIKIAIIDSQQKLIKQIRIPEHQMTIQSKHEGWCEQNPDMWWKHVKEGLHTLFKQSPIKTNIKGIGISYQMHGLVVVDSSGTPLAPSIIWCDSRATKIGQQLYQLTNQNCLIGKILNHPSNFTISKLMWVKNNKKQQFDKIHKIMLPGDFIALKLSGKFQTTKQGLSQGVFWDYTRNRLSSQLLDLCGISKQIFPEIVENFEYQSHTSKEFNEQFGIDQSIPIYYRSGDQPNNAFSLNVLEPGQVAATGGTSGVIYAISSQIKSNQILKFNSFLHVNHTNSQPRIGKLMCISGCGIIYSWLKKQMFPHLSYNQINSIAANHQSEGLIIIPFGNGAQRILGNKDIKCHILNIDFNRHSSNNLIRAAIEGIAFSFVYGANLMRDKQVKLETMRAGKGNIFQCSLFCQILSNLLNVKIEIYETDGAEGAAKAALIGHLKTINKQNGKQFKIQIHKVAQYFPEQNQKQKLQKIKSLYENWKTKLEQLCNKH